MVPGRGLRYGFGKGFKVTYTPEPSSPCSPEIVCLFSSQSVIDVASEATERTRRQHQFGYPVAVSRELLKHGYSGTYALAGLEMHL